jgi:hypothetical protein
MVIGARSINRKNVRPRGESDPFGVVHEAVNLPVLPHD